VRPPRLWSAGSVYTLWRLGWLWRLGVGRGEFVDDDPPASRETPATLAHSLDVAVLNEVALGPVDGGHAVLAQLS
jgi:hypothetical protein